jgi:hypothetical protein
LRWRDEFPMRCKQDVFSHDEKLYGQRSPRANMVRKLTTKKAYVFT